MPQTDLLSEAVPRIARHIQQHGALSAPEIVALVDDRETPSTISGLAPCLLAVANVLAEVRNHPQQQASGQAYRELIGYGVSDATAELALASVSQGAVGRSTPAVSGLSNCAITANPEFISFGQLQPGQPAQATVEVSGGPGQILVPDGVFRVTPDHFTRASTRITVLAPQGGRPGETWFGRLILKSADDVKEIPVSVEWVGAPSGYQTGSGYPTQAQAQSLSLTSAIYPSTAGKRQLLINGRSVLTLLLFCCCGIGVAWMLLARSQQAPDSSRVTSGGLAPKRTVTQNTRGAATPKSEDVIAKELLDRVQARLIILKAAQDAGKLDVSTASTARKSIRTTCQTALRHAELAIKQNPDGKNAWVQRIAALYYLEQFALADKALQQANTRFPRSSDFAPLRALVTRALTNRKR